MISQKWSSTGQWPPPPPGLVGWFTAVCYILMLRFIFIQMMSDFVTSSPLRRASLVPVFSFGENDVFTQKRFPEGSLLHRLQRKGKQLLGFSAPIFHGRGIFNYTFGFLPYRCPINTVGGDTNLYYILAMLFLFNIYHTLIYIYIYIYIYILKYRYI